MIVEETAALPQAFLFYARFADAPEQGWRLELPDRREALLFLRHTNVSAWCHDIWREEVARLEQLRERDDLPRAPVFYSFGVNLAADRATFRLEPGAVNRVDILSLSAMEVRGLEERFVCQWPEEMERQIVNAFAIPNDRYNPQHGPQERLFRDFAGDREDAMTFAMLTQPFPLGGTNASGRNPEARAEKLLREWLSPAQLKQYERDRSFEVTGNASGRRYRIRWGTAYNVDALGRGGRVEQEFCFGPSGCCAAGDFMLAQKITLETNERAALAVANMRRVDAGF